MLHYVLQPRRHQHQSRIAVWEGPDDPRPPPDLAVDALDPVVRPDPAPVLRWEFRVGKRLGEPVAHRPRGRPEPHRFQLLRHLLGFSGACLARFLRVDRLQHARRGLPPGHGNPSQHVAVEMHRAALVAGPGEHLLERTEHPRALVAGDEPYAGEPAPLEPGEKLVRGAHLGRGVHECAVDALEARELVLREEATDAQLGMRSVSMPTHAVRLRSQRPLQLFTPRTVGRPRRLSRRSRPARRGA